MGKLRIERDNKSYLFEEIISEAELCQRVKELGQQISIDYKGKVPIIIGVLNGSFLFMADLIRNLNIEFEVDFIKISSYGNDLKTSGSVSLIKDISANITGRDIIVVEDIVDSGLSVKYLYKKLSNNNPKSINVITCLKKKTKKDIDQLIKYIGFNISSSFVIGYGLDFKQKYRGLNSIYNLKSHTES